MQKYKILCLSARCLSLLFKNKYFRLFWSENGISLHGTLYTGAPSLLGLGDIDQKGEMTGEVISGLSRKRKALLKKTLCENASFSLVECGFTLLYVIVRKPCEQAYFVKIERYVDRL